MATMKDLFKPKEKAKSKAKGNQGLAVSSSDQVASFLQKIAKIPVRTGDARLVFSLDATASRQATWDAASQLQNEMFSSAQALGGLSIQLCYFRGFAEFYTSEWHSSNASLMQKMSTINCQAGATKIELILRHVLTQPKSESVKCVIYIGDAMEENPDVLADLAGKLGLLNIPIFVFQERNDPVAKQCFLEMARLSSGAYSQFDNASADVLKELLKAVAVFAAGGYKALENFSRTSVPEVKLLQQQLGSK